MRNFLIIILSSVLLWSCKSYPSPDEEAERLSTSLNSIIFNSSDRELRIAFLPFFLDDEAFRSSSYSAEAEAGEKMRQLLFDSSQKYLEDSSLKHYLIPLDEVDRIYNELSNTGESPIRPSVASLKGELDADTLILGDLVREDEMEGIGFYNGKSSVVDDGGDNKELMWKFRYLAKVDILWILLDSL